MGPMCVLLGFFKLGCAGTPQDMAVGISISRTAS